MHVAIQGRGLLLRVFTLSNSEGTGGLFSVALSVTPIA